MEGLFSEYNGVKAAGVPADLNGAALTGAKISLAKGDKLAIVINYGDSVAAAVGLTVKQHAGATEKDFNIVNPYFTKVAAETVFTKVAAPDAATLDLAAILSDDEGIVVLEICGEELDVNNDFNEISINLADSTAAKIASVNYVLHTMRFRPAYDQVL